MRSRAAVRRGAEVALISGPTSLEPPSGARVIAVTTAAEMRDAVLKEYSQCTAVIMAAAVADYHAAAVAEKKIKRGRGPVELRLEPSPDILKELGQNKDGQWLVGFAAETEDLIANAQKNCTRKISTWWSPTTSPKTAAVSTATPTSRPSSIAPAPPARCRS